MAAGLLNVSLRYEHDVVLARRRARQIAFLLGFDERDQVRVATAVSEIARNAFLYGERGKVEFLASAGDPQLFQIQISDQGPGIGKLQKILDGDFTSTTGMGIGISGARRLMDQFKIESSPTGTTVLLVKYLPKAAPPLSPSRLTQVASNLADEPSRAPFEELQRQNQELIGAMDELERRQAELTRLNKELEDTNRGVVALYAELDEKADHLRRASELKTQFLSNMSHEFRTPLNSILSLSRMLLDRVDGQLETEQERQVKFIQKAANDLSELVNDLLDLAKVEAGKVSIRPVEFEVTDLFGALRGMLRPLLAHNSSVQLVFDPPEGIPTLNTDESKVSQILRNLISNSLKFTEQGEIRVRTRLEPKDQVTFTVTDTGIGIPQEDVERIFEEFTQLEGPHQTGKTGTGLGLPLSRKLAELLGGVLTLVESHPGRGATFQLTIPQIYRGPGEVSFVPEIKLEIDPARRPVLVVEDNVETLFVYEKYFKGTGFQAVPARTLKQARHALTRFRPVAIILDILLKHENTWAFLTDLKARDSTRDIPVFVVTMVENQTKALALGADDFHDKPVPRSWLLAKLSALSGRPSPDEILIVDDDEISRYVLRGFLAETRFRIIEAATGSDGLRLAKERKPAAIFLDLIMPDKTGFELLEELKSVPLTQEIPVIVHTAQPLNQEERSQLEKRTVAIMPKIHTDRALSLQMIRDSLIQAGVVERL